MPVITMTSAVIVQTTIVSMNGSSSATMPSREGWGTLAAACAMAAEPMPASFENAARWNPTTSTPRNPPPIARGLKAPVKMSLKASGTWLAFITITASAEST